LYARGELEVILQKYNFDLNEVFVDKLRGDDFDLIINLRNQNKNIELDFFRDYYEICSYLSWYHPEEVENSIVRYVYGRFNLEAMLQEVEQNL